MESADGTTTTYYDASGTLTETIIYGDDSYEILDATNTRTYFEEYYINGSYLVYDVTDTTFPVKLYADDKVFKGDWTIVPFIGTVLGHSGEMFFLWHDENGDE